MMTNKEALERIYYTTYSSSIPRVKAYEQLKDVLLDYERLKKQLDTGDTSRDYLDDLIEKRVVHLHIDYYEDKCGNETQYASIKFQNGSVEEREKNL